MLRRFRFFDAGTLRAPQAGSRQHARALHVRAERDVRLSIEALEERNLLTTSTPVEPTFQDLVSVAVVGRDLFYNNSSFDGNTAGVSTSDDAAIATDKSALVSGGTASFANYSSYSRGINGLMVDIAGLPTTTLTTADFDFRVGNSNDPSTWAAAPVPTSITVRLGAGVGGSARVEIIWADNSITKEWLQVTVNATAATGLKTPDVFFFGNAVGESGNSTTDAIVGAADQQAAHNNPTGAAAITSPYDFNRDGAVNATDESIVSANTTTAGTALNLIAPVVATPGPTQEREPSTLFAWGDGGYPAYFGPTLVTTKAGTVIAIAEGRATSRDDTSYALVERRSTDGGITWSPPSTIYAVTPASATIGNIAPVVDLVTGKIFVLFSHNWSEVLITSSSDDGVTWSAATDITPSVKVMAGNNPGPAGVWADTPWGWYVVGPGHGIQLQHGAHAGRLLVAGDHRLTVDNSGPSWSQVVYSDDHGQTWHLGGGLVPNADGSTSFNDNSNESTLVELSNGSIYMSSRLVPSNIDARGYSRSNDGGITWTTMGREGGLTSTSVEGSLLRLDANTLIFSSPNNPDNEIRRAMSIFVSYDDSRTWRLLKTVYFGPSGYSDMTLVGPDTLLLAYGNGSIGGAIFAGQDPSSGIASGAASKISLARINLRWLQSSDPYEFSWYFNEQAPGQTANITGTSIQDYGPWDNRAWARATTAADAPKYVAGANGDSALRLTTNSDEVVLGQGGIQALQFSATDSFTIQVVLRTTAVSGVIIGTRPTVANWALQIVNGKLQFSLNDLTNSSLITSDATINDGNWHRIAAVRDATSRLMTLYVDGVQAAVPTPDTTTKTLVTNDPVVLGAYNTQVAASQLAFDVDTVRITRAALAQGALLPAGFVKSTPPPAPTYSSIAPTSIPGLQLWLPPYDPTKFFNDYGGFADPMSLTPFDGMASHSMLDASPNGYQVATESPYSSILYAHDSTMGPYWKFNAELNSGSQLQARNSNVTAGGAKNFDFVQNTGIFTLSAFFKVDSSTTASQNYMTLFDTSEGGTTLPGFSLFRLQDGTLYLKIGGGTPQTVRYDGAATGTNLAAGQWAQVAVIGSGPGNPVQFYVTPVTASSVTQYLTTTPLAGVDGTYSVDAFHDLTIGNRANTQNGAANAAFNGGMVNATIYNQALTQAQIQQLFQFGKFAVASPWQNPTQPLDVDQNGRIEPKDVLLIINKLNTFGTGPLPTPSAGTSPPPYVDTSGNNSLEPRDVLLVINWLNHNGAGPVPTSTAAASAAASLLSSSTATPSEGSQVGSVNGQDSVGAATTSSIPTLAAISTALSVSASLSSPATGSPAAGVIVPAPDNIASQPAAGVAAVLMVQPLDTTLADPIDAIAESDLSAADATVEPLAADEVFRRYRVVNV